jgi:hypothetical protein
LVNKIKSKMIGSAKPKKFLEKRTSRPSYDQSVFSGTSLGKAMGFTTHKRSLRHLTKQKLSSLLSRGRKGIPGLHSVSSDIEMGSLFGLCKIQGLNTSSKNQHCQDRPVSNVKTIPRL